MKKDYIVKWLRENLTYERFKHSLGTAKMAAELAKKYGYDKEKAELAGLLHDCAKCFSNEKLLEIIEREFPEMKQDGILNYKTLHAPAGHHLAKEVFDISEEEILSAIKSHTLGRVNMSDFEKIIFLADKIEENTRCHVFRNEILEILNENEGKKGLNLALLKCFQETIKSLTERRLHICKPTIDVYNWLLHNI